MIKQKVMKQVLSILLLIVSTNAMAWWNDDWPYRLPITLDTSATGANIATDVDNATILVKLHGGNFQDFFLVNENLSDVRFLAADDKTQLGYQVESVDLINQLIYIWVKLPKVSGNLNTEQFWMYYGNAQATPMTNTVPPYSPETVAVYHFAELSAGVKDSSVNGYNALLAHAEAAPSSWIASGIAFDGSGAIETPIINQLNNGASNGMTASFWVKAGVPTSRATLLAIGDTVSQLQIVIEQNQLFLSTGSVADSVRTSALTENNWHHIAVTYNGGVATLYLDGSAVSQLDNVVLPTSSALSIGADFSSQSDFVGVLDELRVDAVARSADDIKLQLASQSLMGNLLNFHQAEQLGSGGGSSSFWGVILGSTEESGWTIIALLGIMAAVSWLVMVGKAIYILSVSKDNTAFLQQYRQHAADDPALLDHAETDEEKELEDSPILQAVFGKHDHFQSSPIYRVYHRGIQEIGARLGVSAGARAAGLTPAAVSAIKAVVDSQMIREAQRLNSKMVLLTIAISGGPFLGLMGTVVGVMITFAAIAASGDVNIAAIAPGVAAALLTTVAGLVVAIPALFGYNYLASRIKESISDMRVFSDEFITRIAEYYGE